MTHISLGTCELKDSGGLRLECELFIPKVSNMPDISIEFRDDLIPNMHKLAKDPAIAKGVVDFLKSIGYAGPPPLRISDNDGKSLIAEIDLDFMDFAQGLGWVDLSGNEEVGERESLFSILDSEEAKPKLVSKESKNVYVTDGHRYLVLGFSDLSTVVRSGLLENLQRIDSGVLAAHCSPRLAEGVEERRALIAQQKESSIGREDFNEWLKQFLLAEPGFFAAVASSMPKDDVYDIAFGGSLAGKTDNHVVFELRR